MEIVIISIAAFLVAILTFFSGFGLGTLLTPVFSYIISSRSTHCTKRRVHFFNNVFKLILVGKKANKQVVLRFGIPAVIAAFIGAWIMLKMVDLSPLFSYHIGSKTFQVSPIKFTIAILLIIFAAMDLIP